MSDNNQSETCSLSPPITFCIFSFNRAQFLKNCVESIQQSVPFADIWIFDDQSDDADTQAYLRHVDKQVTIVQPGKQGEIKHGGLYHNMQSALERLSERSLLCFLQDDTQVVRPVSIKEIGEIDRVFEQDPNVGFLHPCFIRGVDSLRHAIVEVPGPNESTFYRQDTGQSAGIHYSDLLIARPDRLLHKNWQFFQSEPKNDQQAKRLFGSMLYLYSPFAMWLPEVPAWRGKRKTLGLKLAEKSKRCGFYPFNLWSKAQAGAFLSRTPKTLPVAESFLTCEPQSPAKPWTYNPLTGMRGLKLLNNIEVYVRRMFNKLLRL